MTKKQAPSSLFNALDKFDSNDKQQSEKRRKLNEISYASKSKAVHSQSNIYSSLVEIRILLQRIICNNEDSTETDEDLNDLLSKLLLARSNIPPSTHDDDYDDNSNNNYQNAINNNNNEQEINQLLQNEHETLSQEWKSILNSRYHALRVNLGLATNNNTKNKGNNFNVVDISFWDQIQQTLQHENIIKRNVDSIENEDNNNTIESIVDDSKIYKHMLQEYLSGSSNSKSSSSAHKSQRKSNKNKVDRKASKGRKIKYVTHTKLENFAFAINRPEPIISEDEWFQSLFGGNKK